MVRTSHTHASDDGRQGEARQGWASGDGPQEEGRAAFLFHLPALRGPHPLASSRPSCPFPLPSSWLFLTAITCSGFPCSGSRAPKCGSHKTAWHPLPLLLTFLVMSFLTMVIHIAPFNTLCISFCCFALISPPECQFRGEAVFPCSLRHLKAP